MDAVATTLNRRGLSASADDLRGIAAEIGRMTDTLHRLAGTLPPLDERNAFACLIVPPGSATCEVDTLTAAMVRNRADVLRETAQALQRAQMSGPGLNCFIETFPGDAMRRAAEMTLTGSLSGLSFAYKDVFATADRHPTAGVGRGFRWVGAPPSESLARLARAGAIPIGSLNLDPHCYTATGFNAAFGRVLNPNGPAFAVGGSSSGAAAAVSAGIVPFALGTDTGGSTRIPAALCGVFGLKPTYGLIADAGVYPLSPSQDVVGILAACPAILSSVLDCLTDDRARDQARPIRAPADADRGLRGLRIGINTDGLLAGMDASVKRGLAHAKTATEILGADWTKVPFPSLDDLNLLASVITAFEAAAFHGEALAAHPEFYPASVRRRLLSAVCVTPNLYAVAKMLRGPVLDEVLSRTFATIDVLVCPTIRKAAPRVDDISDDDVVTAGPLSLEFLRLNRPFSYLGLPAISVPMGTDENGIPLGLQIIARPHADRELVALAGCLAAAI
ncbi:amidase [Microvirga antarctica]|uniref:amidase n=1 Tax=Microvirga antarctica TaxID=2819233 RepID=UPI001B317115|nr:amidase [Microvirga antarctica]